MDKKELSAKVAEFMGHDISNKCPVGCNDKVMFVMSSNRVRGLGNNYFQCDKCGKKYAPKICPDCTAPENWGKVMEKLCERHGVNIDKIEITPYKSYSVGVEILYDGGLCQYSTGEHQGDTIGEAVCRAVVAYKEAREANK